MSDQSLVQFRVDKQLKQKAVAICDALGTDLPTVFRMCMKQMEIANGIPFPTKLPNKVVTRDLALNAFEEMRRQAADMEEMSLEEINAEIEASRKEKKGYSNGT